MGDSKMTGHAIETHSCFRFEIGAPAMLAIAKDESLSGDLKWGKSLYDLITEIEFVSDVDYDYMFGSNVFFTIEGAAEEPERIHAVERVIRDRVIKMMGIEYWTALLEGKVKVV